MVSSRLFTVDCLYLFDQGFHSFLNRLDDCHDYSALSDFNEICFRVFVEFLSVFLVLSYVL